jgi:uracil-DNA glycosylase
MLDKLFQEKYGEEIYSILLDELQLKAENIKEKNEADQLIVKRHIEKINQKLGLDLDVNETNWAFDFSGWTGQLDLSKDNIKEYMIIGLEPHVEWCDYQVTYGLSDNAPNGSQRFSLKPKDEKFEIQSEGDSNIIWTNLLKIMASDKLQSEVFEQGNKQALIDFLNQFYIADLCHFAPQGKANEINKIKDWKNIRLKVASYFLTREIDLIKPKVLITQGNDVFTELKKVLKFKETNSYPLRFGKNCWSIKTGEDRKSKYKVLSIPHFGSDLNYKTFYLNNRELVRKSVIDNSLI